MYKLLLSRETFHTFNRVAILSSLTLSFLLPVVHVSVDTDTPVSRGIVMIETAVVHDIAVGSSAPWYQSPMHIFTFVYILGVAVFGVLALVSVFRTVSLLRGGRVIRHPGYRITLLPGDISPFSWFRHIVMSENDYASSSREILTHELAHVASRHSVDMLLCNLLVVLFWVSPALWLFRSELSDVHEYEADEAVLRSGVDASRYQMLLIRKAVGDRLFIIANNLNNNSLKKRIEMMKLQNSNPWRRARLLFVLPLSAAAIALFARPEAVSLSERTAARSDAAMSSVMSGISDITSRIRQDNTMSAIDKNAKKEGLIVSDTAAKKTVWKATIVRDTACLYEKSGPDDVLAGRKSLVFRLSKDSIVQQIDKNDTVTIKITGKHRAALDDCLVVIDDKVVSKEEMQKIAPEHIKSITVLADQEKVKELYGEKAGSRAIIITIKQASQK